MSVYEPIGSTCEVPAPIHFHVNMPRHSNRATRYTARRARPPLCAAVIFGAVAGALVFGALGAAVGLFVNTVMGSDSGWEWLTASLIGAVVAGWVGATLGCFFAAHVMRAADARAISRRMATSVVPATLVGFAVGVLAENLHPSLFIISLLGFPLFAAPALACSRSRSTTVS
ncbi:MAG TPA: hypothetical protein VNC78_01985 [Actinomycetota bacterium]|nr:hypothetical protein [Actinomycetota bacterium]